MTDTVVVVVGKPSARAKVALTVLERSTGERRWHCRGLLHAGSSSPHPPCVVVIDEGTVTLAVSSESTAELSLHTFDLADGTLLHERTFDVEQRGFHFRLLPLEGRLWVLGYGSANEVVAYWLE